MIDCWTVVFPKPFLKISHTLRGLVSPIQNQNGLHHNRVCLMFHLQYFVSAISEIEHEELRNNKPCRTVAFCI